MMICLVKRLAVFGLPVLLVGCMPKMSIEQMRDERPQRPAELDMLNRFVGHWEGTGTGRMAMLEEELASHSTEDIRWEGDDWYLVNRGSYEMGGLGVMKAIMIWYWDSGAKKFRNIWIDNMGSVGNGTSQYDTKTETWHMKSKARGAWGKTIGSGTIKFTDDDTMEWTWTEWDGLKLVKTMEMMGVSHRKAAP